MAAINVLADKNGMAVIGSSPAHADWRKDSEFLALLDTASLVLVNGEGTIHHDRPAARTLLEVGAHARRQGIPAALINCGWESNSAELTDLLSDFALVAVRDSASAHELRRSGVECTIVPDLSLYLDAPLLAERRDGIGFTGSVLRDVALELDQLRRRLGGVSMPIQFSDPGLVGTWRFFREYLARRDIGDPKRILALISSRHVQYRSQTRSEDGYIAALSGVKLLVTGRFHACTLALLAETPFLAAGTNSSKILSLVADAGLADWRAGKRLTREAVEGACRKGWSGQELSNVRRFVASARDGANALFARIQALPS
jgi:polysaccharide pyruvyl transferase WcaK-like protein